jgi:hypothetical protein
VDHPARGLAGRRRGGGAAGHAPVPAPGPERDREHAADRDDQCFRPPGGGVGRGLPRRLFAGPRGHGAAGRDARGHDAGAERVSDRAAITSAAGDVGSCGPNLAAAPKVFDDAAGSRQSLLAGLTAAGGRAALPPALVSDLTQAWQASIAADQAYAKWANDEITQGCVKDDTNDPGYRATITPNLNATKYKTAFVAQWNPIAAKYGLKQYQPGQL